MPKPGSLDVTFAISDKLATPTINYATIKFKSGDFKPELLMSLPDVNRLPQTLEDVLAGNVETVQQLIDMGPLERAAMPFTGTLKPSALTGEGGATSAFSYDWPDGGRSKSQILGNLPGYSSAAGGASAPSAGGPPRASALQQTKLTRTLESLIEADKKFSRQAKREVDALEESLKTMHDYFEKLERDIRKEQREIERQLANKDAMEKQIGYLRERIATLTEERRQTTVSVITGAVSTKAHYAEEIQYLEELNVECARQIDGTKDTNSMLEKHYHAMDLQVTKLEQARREVGAEIRTEKDTIQREERENAQLKTNIENLNRKLLLANYNQGLAAVPATSGGNNQVTSDGLFVSVAKPPATAGAMMVGQGGLGGTSKRRGEENPGNDFNTNSDKATHSWAGMLTSAGNLPGSAASLGGNTKSMPRTYPAAFDREGV